MRARLRLKWRARWHRGSALIYLRNGTVIRVKRDPKVPPAKYMETYSNSLKTSSEPVWVFSWNGTAAVTVMKSEVVAIEAF